MKKIVSSFLLFTLSLVLVACGNGAADSTSASSSQEQYVQLIVSQKDSKLDEKVTFEEGQTVMDVLKANYKVVEKDGMVTAIDGVMQDEKEKIYWMYKVNDEMASKGASELKVEADDKIEFYLEDFE